MDIPDRETRRNRIAEDAKLISGQGGTTCARLRTTASTGRRRRRRLRPPSGAGRCWRRSSSNSCSDADVSQPPRARKDRLASRLQAIPKRSSRSDSSKVAAAWATAAIPRSASFQSARRARTVVSAGPARAPMTKARRAGPPPGAWRGRRGCAWGRTMRPAPMDREHKGASDAVLVAPIAREGRSELGPRRCAARRRSSSHAFVRPCESCHGELGFGGCLWQSFRWELVTRRSIAVCSVLRRGNWNPALAVLNKHLAVAH